MPRADRRAGPGPPRADALLEGRPPRHGRHRRPTSQTAQGRTRSARTSPARPPLTETACPSPANGHSGGRREWSSLSARLPTGRPELRRPPGRGVHRPRPVPVPANRGAPRPRPRQRPGERRRGLGAAEPGELCPTGVDDWLYDPDPEVCVPIACVEICDLANRDAPSRGSSKRSSPDCEPRYGFCPTAPDTCRVRPFVYRNPLLYELVKGCDVELPRVQEISWQDWIDRGWRERVRVVGVRAADHTPTDGFDDPVHPTDPGGRRSTPPASSSPP